MSGLNLHVPVIKKEINDASKVSANVFDKNRDILRFKRLFCALDISVADLTKSIALREFEHRGAAGNFCAHKFFFASLFKKQIDENRNCGFGKLFRVSPIHCFRKKYMGKSSDFFLPVINADPDATAKNGAQYLRTCSNLELCDAYID